MKRAICTFVLFAGVVLSLSAQRSITRFAVVDMNKILREIVPDSKALSERQTKFESDMVKHNENRNNLTVETYKLNEELEKLKSKLSDAQKSNEDASVIKDIENQIKAKEQEMRTFLESGRTAFNRESERLERERKYLEDERAKLITPEIKQRIYNAIQGVAGTEGYNMVLDRDTSGVLWYSGEIDITNRVIERLRSPRR
jgi:outer membrane protein